jgi:hypothetical protein
MFVRSTTCAIQRIRGNISLRVRQWQLYFRCHGWTRVFQEWLHEYPSKWLLSDPTRTGIIPALECLQSSQMRTVRCWDPKWMAPVQNWQGVDRSRSSLPSLTFWIRRRQLRRRSCRLLVGDALRIRPSGKKHFLETPQRRQQWRR